MATPMRTMNVKQILCTAFIFIQFGIIGVDAGEVLHSDGFVHILLTGRVVDQQAGKPIGGAEVFDITGNLDRIWSATRCDDVSGEFRLKASFGFVSTTSYRKNSGEENFRVYPVYLLVWKTGYAPLVMFVPGSVPKRREDIPETIDLGEIRLTTTDALEKRISNYKKDCNPKADHDQESLRKKGTGMNDR